MLITDCCTKLHTSNYLGSTPFRTTYTWHRSGAVEMIFRRVMLTLAKNYLDMETETLTGKNPYLRKMDQRLSLSIKIKTWQVVPIWDLIMMMAMAAALPDELWRRILELGIENQNLNYKDLSCISISCRRLHRLSNEDVVWSVLLSHDFPQTQTDPSSSSSSLSSSKSLYQLRFEKDRARKLAANRRALLRMESQVAEHSRKLRQLQLQLDDETQTMKSTFVELSNLRNVRHASVALNVWQPEIIRGRQKQIVEQCVVPVESRISALEMELRLCKKQIAGIDKAYGNEKKRLEAANEQLECMKYHPLRDYKLESSKVDECKIKKKKKSKKKH